MKFAYFRHILHQHSYFSTDWLYRYFPNFDKRRLFERNKKGLIRKLKRGWYLFDGITLDRSLALHLAGVLYRPSYISLMTALSYYGLIPETVVTIQSISTKKTTNISCERAHREYRSCKPTMFEGYSIQQSPHGSILIATVEKMIVDIMYYYPQYRGYEDIQSLRINHEVRSQLDVDLSLMRTYASHTGSQVTIKAIETFIMYMH